MAQDSVATSSAKFVFAVLRLAATSDAPLSITEISRRLRVSVNKAYRAAITLESAGYLRRHQPDGRFEIGPVAEQLVFAAFQQFHIRHAVAPYLRQIATSAEATTSLAVRVGWYAINLVLVESGGNVVSRTRRLGRVALLDTVAAGLAILACLPSDQLKYFLAFADRHRQTSSPAHRANQKGLAAFKRAGFATAFEADRRFFALAIPLRDSNGDPTASITIEAPASRQVPLDADPLINDWLKIAARAETILRADPGKFANPFASLDPDQIVFAAS
jgi:DNA-binding IclR family transcriptional regulator